MERMVVRLLKPYMQLNAGEVGSFITSQAKKLIEIGAAVEVKQEAAQQEQPKEAPQRVDKMEHGEQARPRRSRQASANGN